MSITDAALCLPVVELPLCESPLELEFGMAVVRRLGVLWRYWPPPNEQPCVLGRIHDWGAVFVHQWTVGNWRIDFALIGFSDLDFPLRDGAEPPSTMLNIVTIEVDGHQYHERTKEQARRDRSRDRKQISFGWAPLRFTGWEVYTDPAACADEALTVFFERQRKVLADYHDVRPEPWPQGPAAYQEAAQ
jgi:very-short-patch-repair endonuclease